MAPLQKRDKFVKARLNSMEYAIVKARAERAGISMYEYMRQALLKAKFIKPITPEQVALLKSLRAKLNEAEDDVGFYPEGHNFARLLEELGSLLENIQNQLS